MSRISGYYRALNYLYESFIKGDRHEQYYTAAINWVRNNNLLPATSDISALISKLDDLPHSEDVSLYREWELFKDFGLSQILHLEYVDHIYDLLKREDRGLSMKPQDFFYQSQIIQMKNCCANITCSIRPYEFLIIITNTTILKNNSYHLSKKTFQKRL